MDGQRIRNLRRIAVFGLGIRVNNDGVAAGLYGCRVVAAERYEQVDRNIKTSNTHKKTAAQLPVRYASADKNTTVRLACPPWRQRGGLQ